MRNNKSKNKKIDTDRKKENKKKMVSSISPEKILILSVDRDDDVGRLVSVSGPIIGIEKNIKLATSLAIADPEESDANCIFAAIKRYNALKDKYIVEIATLTGHSKSKLLFADRNINEQLKQVLEIFPASSAVFVTDGAEDDQVIPIIQNYLPIMSKELVIVRQARHIESIFYTVKKALEDPFFARLFFGLPAIMILLLVFGGQYGLQILGLIFGFYLLMKGFNLDVKISKIFKALVSKFSIQRVSFPFYLGSLFLFIFAIVSGINLYITNTQFGVFLRIIYILRAVLLFFVFSILSFVVGDIVDLFYFKQLYKLGYDIFSLISIFVFSILLDSSLQLIIYKINFISFIYIVIISSILLFLVHKITRIFDVSKDVSELLIGLPVVSKYGLWLGEVTSVDKKRKVIKYRNKLTNKERVVSKSHFNLDNGKVVI